MTTAEPIFGPCVAVITPLIDKMLPNAVTRAAMDEPSKDLPSYPTASQAKAALGI